MIPLRRYKKSQKVLVWTAIVSKEQNHPRPNDRPVGQVELPGKSKPTPRAWEIDSQKEVRPSLMRVPLYPPQKLCRALLCQLLCSRFRRQKAFLSWFLREKKYQLLLR